VVYGRDPPTIRSYEQGEARVAAVAQEMEGRAAFLDDIRVRLEQAQAVQKRVYDQHHRRVVFTVGDWALLRLRQRAAASMPRAVRGKLKPRFVGPYKVTEVINEAAVRLELPPDARLHDVFHVGVLKKFVGSPPAAPPALPPLSNGAVVPAPSRVTQGRLARGVRQVLVEWEGHDPAAASWEDLDDFRTRFPSFQLEDKLDFEAGRDVMCGRVYARRRRARDIRRAAECASQARNAPSEADQAGRG